MAGFVVRIGHFYGDHTDIKKPPPDILLVVVLGRIMSRRAPPRERYRSNDKPLGTTQATSAYRQSIQIRILVRYEKGRLVARSLGLTRERN